MIDGAGVLTERPEAIGTFKPYGGTPRASSDLRVLVGRRGHHRI